MSLDQQDLRNKLEKTNIKPIKREKEIVRKDKGVKVDDDDPLHQFNDDDDDDVIS